MIPIHKVGAYHLVRQIGAGGMGDVYLGLSATADLAAVKMIRPHLVSGHTMRQRFASEVESLKMVFGSRVARLEDADPYAEPPWLAVEYVPGLTLKQYVEQHGPLPLDIAAILGAMLAEGLTKVHQAGLLHRDLKPQNIILGDRGPVLIDFGLAVLVEREPTAEHTASGVMVGTPAYMAPEQARGEGHLTAAVDIYALGASLVFAVAGHTTYPQTHPHALLDRVTDPDDLPDLTGVPTGMAPLIGAMLAFDASARPSLIAVQDRLLKLAVSASRSVTEVRTELVTTTFHPVCDIEVPAGSLDPVEDPEGETSLKSIDKTADTATPTPLDVDSAPTGLPAPNVGWLVEKLRLQYARRSTF